jgi:hypothetical protein
VDSAYVAEFTGGWTDAMELRAATVELIHALYRATLAAHGSKRVPKQVKVPRPQPDIASVTPIRRDPSEDEVAAFFSKGR